MAQTALLKSSGSPPTPKASSEGTAIVVNDENLVATASLSQQSDPGKASISGQASTREPSRQHIDYTKKLVESGIHLDLVDELGYKPLDYAIHHEDTSAEALVLDGLRRQLDERRASRRLHEAKVRKGYREVFEGQLRPLLLSGHKDALEQMRYSYANALETDETQTQMFDGLRFVWYSDFCKSGRLPRYTDGTLRTFSSRRECGSYSDNPDYIIYIAYRWIHKDPMTGKTANDDKVHTQYRRMLRALDDYLTLHNAIDREKLGIWLDSACIDRTRPLPGIAALPINLAQCNALITIEDELFWSRAWCSVEAHMIQILRKSYEHHEWYRYAPAHGIISRDSDKGEWTLCEALLDVEIDISTKDMTWEEDRDKITFLERQAKLL